MGERGDFSRVDTQRWLKDFDGALMSAQWNCTKDLLKQWSGRDFPFHDGCRSHSQVFKGIFQLRISRISRIEEMNMKCVLQRFSFA